MVHCVAAVAHVGVLQSGKVLQCVRSCQVASTCLLSSLSLVMCAGGGL